MNVVAAFFLLGAAARLLRSDIDFPRSLYQSLTLFLLALVAG